MCFRSAMFLAVFSQAVSGLSFAASAGQTIAQDAVTCFNVAEQITGGAKLEEAEKNAAHEACQRALAASSNVVQKYHLQEADFDITGTRPKE